MYRTYLFDMDGTVLDTAGDLCDAVNHTLRARGYPERTVEQVIAATGNGAARLMAESLPEGENTPDFAAILAAYKTYYEAHNCVRTGPYPGMAQLLADLQRRGVRVAIVSNKPHPAAALLGQRFFPGIPVVGESPERRRKPAPDMVDYALTLLGADKAGAVYVGDSEVDAATAKNAGLPLIAVTWGFRSAEALRRLGVERLAFTAEDILSFSEGK